MLRIGIIGVGTVAEVHLSALQDMEDAKLVALSDTNPEKKDRLPNKPFYETYHDMLAQENLDVVHICLPHYKHVEVAIDCLEAGVNVLLEKPVAMSYAEGKKLEEVADKCDQKIAVCFQNRFNPTSILLRDALEHLDEEVLYVRGYVPWYRKEGYYEEKPWRGEWEKAGGGTIINQAIHTLDLMQLAAGKPWESLRAAMVNLSGYNIEVEDTVVANIQFEDGVSGYWNSTNVYKGNSAVEVEVITERHRFNIRNYKLYMTDHNGIERLIGSDDPVEGTKIYYGPSHEKAITSFYQDIMNNTHNYCSVSDALATISLIDGMKLSTQRNQEQVKAEEIING